MKRMLMIGLSGLLLTGMSSLFGAIVIVPGTANVFSAGQDANGGSPGGGTYAVLGVGGFTGGTITFNSVTGTTNCGAGAPCNAPPIGPDGASLVFSVGANDGTNIPTAGVGTGIGGIVFTGREM